MFKTGVYRKSQIKKMLVSKDLFDDKKTVSITLYEDIQVEPNADELAERILLLFADERGAYKRTYTKRFEDFDKIVLEYLKENFKGNLALTIHDVAVSDGRTATDFFEKVSLAFPHIKYTASDYNPEVYVVEKGKCKITLSHTGKILEFLFPPFVFNMIKRDGYKDYPVNHLIRLGIQLFLVSPLVKKYRLGEIQARTLRLFSPRALRLEKEDGRLSLTQHDLLKPFKERSDIIRAMNVLNLSYFSESDFLKVFKNIYSGLKEDGLFITGSNQEAGTVVQGGIYKKIKGGFQQVKQSGEGSPIHQLILKFNEAINAHNPRHILS